MARRKRRRSPNNGGSIDQRPSGRWRLRVSVDGRQVLYGVYETEEDAIRAQGRWRTTMLLPADDPDPSLELPPGAEANMAVGGVRCDEWFERWQEAKAGRRSVVRVGHGRGGSESTSARDRAQWRRWWKPAIGERLPQTLEAVDIADVLRRMEEAGRAPNTLRTHWLMMRALCNWMVDQGVLAASPMADLRLTVDPALDRVRKIVVPDFRFIDLLERELPTTQDRLVFELLLGTGGRRSEVAGMRIGDVDLAAKRVWIRQPVVEVEGRLVRNPVPKGGRVRAVIVGPQLAELLKAHLAGRGDAGEDEALFVGPKGGGFRWNNYVERTFRPAVVAASKHWATAERNRLVKSGMDRSAATDQASAEAERLRGLTPHHLRHTAAALLWAAGASDLEVQLILGHADVETSKRLYAHLLSDSADNAAARVEQLRQARRVGL